MKYIEPLLGRLAHEQVRHSHIFIAVTIAITLIMLSSIQGLRLEGDIMAQMPQGLDAFKNQDKLTSKFGGTDTVMVLLYIDPEFGVKTGLDDIRDPAVINTLIDLDSLLSEESSVNRILSPAAIFRQTGVPPTSEGVRQVIKAIPGSEAFFSDDKTAVIMYLSVDVGTSPEKINTLTNSLRDKLRQVTPPTGTKIAVTGSPQILAIVMKMLQEDAGFTMFIAITLISILLLIIFRFRGVLTILPILLAVSWMYGTMAWFNIPLSIATAGVGAMILGLSVEYDVFFIERFEEEYHKLRNYDHALLSALPKVGLSILGSSLTTITGFLALLLSLMPMLQNLGLTLALGIFYSFVVDIVFNPVIILEVEKKRHGWWARRVVCNAKIAEEELKHIEDEVREIGDEIEGGFLDE